MSKATAKKIEVLISQLEGLQLEVQDLLDDAQTEFDGKSEKWQESEKGTEAEATINNLECAIENIESAVTSLNESVAA
jgi:hypothetical protein